MQQLYAAPRKIKKFIFKHRHVTLVDIDPDALEIAQENIENLEVENIEIINIDVLQIPKSFFKKFDIVITNPPFGIRSEKAADIKFLKKAMNVCYLYIIIV